VCSPTWRGLRLPRKGREPIRRTFSVAALDGNSDTIPQRGIAHRVRLRVFHIPLLFKPRSSALWKWEGRVRASISLLSRASDAIVDARLFSRVRRLATTRRRYFSTATEFAFSPRKTDGRLNRCYYGERRGETLREKRLLLAVHKHVSFALGESRLARGTFIIAHGRNVLIH